MLNFQKMLCPQNHEKCFRGKYFKTTSHQVCGSIVIHPVKLCTEHKKNTISKDCPDVIVAKHKMISCKHQFHD